eukprot:TRINITY_DN109910_c0_g1_i1.p1 TRINITY_DN109910_c0_g1~~TRINITY_DN109910_c0_g1_i1.p1  ORF type:complete len:1320 (+),score=436.55 TRINITY_DN109910_c0_g1_i1:137-4096(+)
MMKGDLLDDSDIEEEYGEVGKAGGIAEYLKKKTPDEVFDEFDADGSGTIDMDEFRTMLKALNIKMTEAKARKYFRLCDGDGSGEIDREEFKVAMYACDPVSGNTMGFTPSKLLTPQDAFEMFDDNGSGELDEDEFYNVLEYLGVQANDEEMENMFLKFDTDGSGFIDYDEFKKAWLRLSNPREELAKRGIVVSRWATNAMLAKRLEEVLDEEEEKEGKALAQAQRWSKWQAELSEKRVMIAEAKERAKLELASCLDSAGQVYVFGGGTHGQFTADPRDDGSLQYFDHIEKLWKERVEVKPTDTGMGAEMTDPIPPPVRPDLEDGAPTKRSANATQRSTARETARSMGLSTIRSLLDDGTSRTKDDDEDSLDYSDLSDDVDLSESEPEDEGPLSPFTDMMVATNGCSLWAQGILESSVGESVAYCRTNKGQIWAWGGKDAWHEYSLPESKVARGDLTHRSTLLLNVPVTQKKKERKELLLTAIADKEAEDSKVEDWKIVCQFYGIWEPPPSTKLRMEHYENVLLPKVEFQKLLLSLELRNKDTSDKNKVELMTFLAEDIRFERKNLKEAKREELQEIENDVYALQLRKKVSAANDLKKKFVKIWKPLLDKQLEIKAANSEKESEIEKKALEKMDEDYWKSRRLKERSLARTDIIKTPRGHDLEIKLGGFTARGPDSTVQLGSTKFVKMAAGGQHAAALHATERVYVWGCGVFGRLGLGAGATGADGLRHDRSHPALLDGLAAVKVADISCGFSHSAAVTKGGRLWIWGGASTGKLGLGEVTEDHECFCPSPTRVRLPNNVKIRSVSCGNSHTAAVGIEGQLFVWGCTDGGRLGLGKSASGSFTTPLLVSALWNRGIKVHQVSCGCTHTAFVTPIEESVSGFGLDAQTVLQGGEVYVAGPSVVLGMNFFDFTKVDGLKDEYVKQVSAGYSHTGAITARGELYTWGSNRKGCSGHPIGIDFLAQPSIVRCLYTAPKNLAMKRWATQSSTYSGYGAQIAVTGSTDGSGEGHCCHTQIDYQPWWQVDLGSDAVIEEIKVWNRADEPIDQSLPRDTFTKRMYPCVVLISEVPFPDDVSGGLDKAKNVAATYKRFTVNRRCSAWTLPMGTTGRYVRVQLERKSYLHLAQVEVFGVFGLRRSIGRVDHVDCGNQVSVVTMHALKTDKELEQAFIRAVAADPHHALILRQFPAFYKAYDTHNQGTKVKNCPLDVGPALCPWCKLLKRWNVDISKKEFKDPLSRVLGLDKISKILIEAPPPELEWESKLKKKTAGIMDKTTNVARGLKRLFTRKGKALTETAKGMSSRALTKSSSKKDKKDEKKKKKKK